MLNAGDTLSVPAAAQQQHCSLRVGFHLCNIFCGSLVSCRRASNINKIIEHTLLPTRLPKLMHVKRTMAYLYTQPSS